MKELIIDQFESPLGRIAAVTSGDHLLHLDFCDCRTRMEQLLTRRYKTFTLAPKENPLNIRESLHAYFRKDWNSFDFMSLLTNGTDFQQRVWKQLQQISPGTTISYTQLAEAINHPKAIRAVANANAQNPIAIIIPCHRVIAKNGALAGYAGGPHRKSWLLKHEKDPVD
jgi:methylated-DNA-[protein]-cysteine S-methyltransferase